MLSKSYFFKGDLQPYRDLFLQYCPPALALPKHALICKKGYPQNWMYYILEGMVKIYTTNYAGYERIIGYAQNDTIFGLDCLIPGTVSVSSAESITPIKVLPFNIDILRSMLENEPALAAKIVTYCSRIIHQLSFDAENQSINSVTTRLANFTYLYLENFGFKQDRVNLTQESLASAINASRVQVARCIKDLKKEGIITTAHKGIIVKNLARLKELCEL